MKQNLKAISLAAIIGLTTSCGGGGTPTATTTNLNKAQSAQVLTDNGASLVSNPATPTFWNLTTNENVNTPTATITYSQLDDSKCDTYSGGNLGQFSVLNCDSDAGLMTTEATPTIYVSAGDVSNLQSLGNNGKVVQVINENMTQEDLEARLSEIQGGNVKVQGEPIQYAIDSNDLGGWNNTYTNIFGKGTISSAFFFGTNSSAPTNANLVDLAGNIQENKAIDYVGSPTNTFTISSPNSPNLPNGLFTIVNPNTNEVIGLVRNQVRKNGKICDENSQFYTPSTDSCENN